MTLESCRFSRIGFSVVTSPSFRVETVNYRETVTCSIVLKRHEVTRVDVLPLSSISIPTTFVVY